MKRTPLVSSILLGLSATLALQTVHAQASGDQPDASQDTKKKEEKLQTVVVTGSLIPQAQVENASPIVTITAQQMERQGFGTVYEALRAQPLATGAVQDNQTTFFGGFTSSATTISLLGLDPGFTLFLVNGHPLTNYPLLYNGLSNFVDLTNIPAGMIDHIDILPGNQSSIYGSSAIAGVVNIILKDKVDGYELNARVGGYSGGGGANQRLEFLGGKSWGNLDVTFGLQLGNQLPIWAFDRPITASTQSNPDPTQRFGVRNFLYLYYDNAFNPHYVDPGTSTCDSLSSLAHGTITRQFRPGRGYYCGSDTEGADLTLQDRDRSGNTYVNLKYKLNDNAEAYANVLYSLSTIRDSSGPYFWDTNLAGNGIFVNATTGRLEVFQHSFSPEEIGGSDLYSDHNINRSYQAWGGLRGSVGSAWDYDVYYARSQTNVIDKNPWPLNGPIQSFFENQFLGPKLGTYYGYPIYSPNTANFYKAVTPAQYATFAGVAETRSSTWTQNLNLQVNNADLFSLPAGSAGFAGLLQVGNTSWNNPADPAVVAGDFYGLTGTSGGGSRDNWAAAAELRVPIISTFTADASARYDQYSNTGAGTSDSKATYKLGLEYRPIESVLVRGNYATAFRAPDLAYTFGGKSGFFNQNNTDYYRCAVVEPNVPLNQCDYYNSVQIFGVHQGNPDLKSITAKSFGYGVVWSPTSDFDVKADYYNVRIQNEVQVQNQDQLLKDDSACLLGQLDINSPTCKAAIAQVLRSPQTTGPNAYAIEQVTLEPINVAKEHVSGILASLHYKQSLGRWGDIGVQGQYNVTLSHTQQLYPFDPTIDLLRSPYYSTEFKTIANESITWSIDKFSATLLGTRYGKTPNYIAQLNSIGYGSPGAGTVAPWILYNGSVSYDIDDNLRVSGIVNNIKNSMPPKDNTYTLFPYYNFLSFNAYGRSYWLEFDWRFGRSN